MNITRAIDSLVSGECRWVGREDVHVYCHAPLGRPARYCVVCPDADLAYGTWTDAKSAARIVSHVLKLEAAA